MRSPRLWPAIPESELLAFWRLDSLGIVLWSGAYLGVGYLFSDQVEDALGYAQRLGSGVLILLAALFAAWILWKFIQTPAIPKANSKWRGLRPRNCGIASAPAKIYTLSICAQHWITIGRPFPGAIRLSIEDLTSNSNRFPAIGRSFCIALDQTKPPAPVRRCSSNPMASLKCVHCREAQRHGPK